MRQSLERDAHRIVLELIEGKHTINDAESNASRILLARSDPPCARPISIRLINN
jgi:hypothetical protein